MHTNSKCNNEAVTTTNLQEFDCAGSFLTQVVKKRTPSCIAVSTQASH